MIDIIASIKEPKHRFMVEALHEYSLGEIAEKHFEESKDWEIAYEFAAVCLSDSPENIAKIRSNYPPIFDIAKGSNIKQLSPEYFIKVMKEKDPQAVIQALINIDLWHSKKNPEYSSWATMMASSLVNRWNTPGVGDAGNCKCKECDYSCPTQIGMECNNVICPNCNVPLNKLEPIGVIVFLPSEKLRKEFLKEKRTNPLELSIIEPTEAPKLPVRVNEPASFDEVFFKVPFSAIEIEPFTRETPSEDSKAMDHKLYLIKAAIQKDRGLGIEDSTIKKGLEQANFKDWSIAMVM